MNRGTVPDYRGQTTRYEAEGWDVRNPVFVLADDVDWMAVACLHATLHRQALFSWREPAFRAVNQRRLESFTLVGPPHMLEGRELHRAAALAGQIEPAPPRRVPWGILTARDAAAARRLVLRSARARWAPGPPRRVLISSAHPIEGIPASLAGDLTLIDHREAGAETIRAVLAQGADLLSFLAHGRDDALWIRKGLICGRRPGGVGSPRSYGGLPSCAYTNTCYQPGREVVDASTLKATVVFVNSCSTLKLGSSVFPTSYNVVLRMMDGEPCAVIASPFVTDGELWQNVLFHVLAGSGIPIGRALAVVNSATMHSGLDFPGMVLVGDPLLRLQAHAQVVGAAPLPGDTWRVQAGGACCAHAAMPLPPQLPAQDTFFVSVRDGRVARETPVFYAFDRTEGALDVYLFSLAPLPESLCFTVRAGSPMSPLRQSVEETTRGLQGAEWLGIRDPKLERVAAELRNSLRSLQDVAQAHRYSVHSVLKVMERTRRFLDLKAKADGLLLDWLLTHTDRHNLQLYELYKPGYSAGGWEWGRDTCRDCGQPLVCFTVASHLVAHCERTVRLCATCGVVHDSPDGLEAWLEGDSILRGSIPASVSLVLSNRADRERSGMAGAAVVNGAMNGIALQDQARPFRLPPGGTVHLAFRLQAVETTPQHHFWLRAYAADGGSICMASRNIWVVPGVQA